MAYILNANDELMTNQRSLFFFITCVSNLKPIALQILTREFLFVEELKTILFSAEF